MQSATQQPPEQTRIERLAADCEAGDVESCYLAGVSLELGAGVPADRLRAIDYYSDACALGHEASCRALRQRVAEPLPGRVGGRSEAFEQEPEAPPKREEPVLEGDQFYLGLGGVKKNLEWARALYQMDCEKEAVAEACVKAGVMQATGEGGGVFHEAAFRSLDLACDLDRSRCMDIALMYEHGEFGMLDLDDDEWFRKRALRSEGKRECRYGAAERCVYYAQAFLIGAGGDREPEYAFVLLKEACEQGDPLGCMELADLYLAGVGTAKDEARAVQLYQRACKAHQGTACWKLGRLYLRGEHVGQDPTEAERLFAVACAYGCQAGCDYVDKRPR